MSRPEVLSSVLVGERRSAKKSKAFDNKMCVVTQRLAWLADGSNWDGTLPTPKPRSPTSRLKSTCAARRGIGGGSDCIEQAPGWDGQVVEVLRSTKGECPRVERAATNSRPGGTGGEHDKSHAGSATARGATPAVVDGELRSCVSTGAQVKEQEILFADEEQNAENGIANVNLTTHSSLAGKAWSVQSPASHEGLQPAAGQQSMGHSTVSHDSDEDTDSRGDHLVEGGIGCADETFEHIVAFDSCNSLGDRHANDSDFVGIAPDASDTNSEASCLTVQSSGTDDDRSRERQQLHENESFIHASIESPNQARMTTCDDGDIGESHVAYLLQARRRWQLRAIQSEHELASMRSLHARMGTCAASSTRSPPFESNENQDPSFMMVEESTASSQLSSSEQSAVRSGFDADGEFEAMNGLEGEVSPSSPRQAFLNPAGEVETLRSISNAIDQLPKRESQYGATITESNCSTPVANDDEGGGILCNHGHGTDGDGWQRKTDTDRSERSVSYSDGDGAFGHGDAVQGRNDGASNRQLLEEIVELKESLRKSELRHAAAEATAASVLQRARAAELARDVKEIKIRNLEIRLDRHATNSKYTREACARRREQRNSDGNENTEMDNKIECVRRPTEQLLADDEEEPSSPRSDGGITTRNSTPSISIRPAALREPPVWAIFAAGAEERSSEGPAAAGGRAALHRFRQSCAVLGAKAARAGGEAVVAAATAVAAAREATKGVMHSTTAAARNESVDGLARQAVNDQLSQDETAGSVEEYWGSDYCTPV